MDEEGLGFLDKKTNEPKKKKKITTTEKGEFKKKKKKKKKNHHCPHANKFSSWRLPSAWVFQGKFFFFFFATYCIGLLSDVLREIFISTHSLQILTEKPLSLFPCLLYLLQSSKEVVSHCSLDVEVVINVFNLFIYFCSPVGQIHDGYFQGYTC